jgi:hypothetical protein
MKTILKLKHFDTFDLFSSFFLVSVDEMNHIFIVLLSECNGEIFAIL